MSVILLRHIASVSELIEVLVSSFTFDVLATLGSSTSLLFFVYSIIFSLNLDIELVCFPFEELLNKFGVLYCTHLLFFSLIENISKFCRSIDVSHGR